MLLERRTYVNAIADAILGSERIGCKRNAGVSFIPSTEEGKTIIIKR